MCRFCMRCNGSESAAEFIAAHPISHESLSLYCVEKSAEYFVCATASHQTMSIFPNAISPHTHTHIHSIKGRTFAEKMLKNSKWIQRKNKIILLCIVCAYSAHIVHTKKSTIHCLISPSLYGCLWAMFIINVIK